MAVRPAPEFQVWLKEALAARLRLDIRIEWAAFPGLATYSPRVDVAVGPFSVEEGTLGPQYDAMVEERRCLLRKLCGLHTDNVQSYDPSEKAVDVDMSRSTTGMPDALLPSRSRTRAHVSI